MLVTPHFSLTSETFTPNIPHCETWVQAENGCFDLLGEPFPDNLGDSPSVAQLFPKHKLDSLWYVRPATKFQSVGFCDWLSIYQRHNFDLPVICDGAFIRVDVHGETTNTTLKKVRVEGSHESAVFIRSDGHTVWFEGNVSKYGRPDNVFGFTFQQCILRINNLLAQHGLPPFTDGESYLTNHQGQPRTIWTGAMVTRVDVTQNFVTGSKEDAYHFLRWLQGQQASRLKTGTHGDGETVDYGRGSRRVYSKAYLKGPELRKHLKKAPPASPIEGLGRLFDEPANTYLETLADWCDSVGLVRFETTYKSTWLHDNGCHYLGSFDMKQIEIDFEERKAVLSRGSAEVEELASLPKHLLGTYRMWQQGDAVSQKLSRATFYKHRSALLPYGCDIAIKSNVVPLKTRTRVIQLGPVSPPDFYELPIIERKRYGTHG